MLDFTGDDVDKCDKCGFAIKAEGLKTITCICLAATVDEVRAAFAAALANPSEDALYRLYAWCEDVTEGEGEPLSGEYSLAFYEYTNPASGPFYHNDAELRRVLQSLLDIGCAPFHWQCEHTPRHEVA